MTQEHSAIEKEKGTLWCPIRKKYIEDRPEERIRLGVIEFLRGRGCPLSALQVEYQVGEAGRFDVAVFRRSGDVWLLVECKRPLPGKSYRRILLEAQAQVLRYVQALEKRWKVYYLGFAIGEQFYCFDYNRKRWIQELPPYPDL